MYCDVKKALIRYEFVHLSVKKIFQEKAEKWTGLVVKDILLIFVSDNAEQGTSLVVF